MTDGFSMPFFTVPRIWHVARPHGHNWTRFESRSWNPRRPVVSIVRYARNHPSRNSSSVLPVGLSGTVRTRAGTRTWRTTGRSVGPLRNNLLIFDKCVNKYSLPCSHVRSTTFEQVSHQTDSKKQWDDPGPHDQAQVPYMGRPSRLVPGRLSHCSGR